ncbi:glycosyltransferase [Clostridium perfringens]|uniref:glycosyltransferase n=1 Tax=Clostridium perfringens TaxID=1502 RepID=UPI000E17C791|nr:glycosyltransferase [Clostridium perfringens]UBK83911.1 glycosyltransferase [Clostridium perfringens]SUY32572.1 glycosyltransferase [Clostridium perfringens]
MKKLLFYDAYALNKSEIIGGSSKSLSSLLRMNDDRCEVYFLTNESNREYFNENIKKYGVKELYFNFPSELMKYGKKNREKYEKSIFQKLKMIFIYIIPLNLKIRNKLKKNKFDTVICNELRATSVVGLSTLFSNIKLISFIRGDFNLLSSKNKFFMKISNQLICISKGIYDLIPEKEKFKSKVINESIIIDNSIVYNKANSDEFITITTIGNIVYYKGHQVLIEALSKVKNKKINLEIIGSIVDKDHYLYLLKLIEKYKLTDRIKFKGKQENVYTFLNKSNIFVLPSINEGLGIVNLEAAIHKLPIIASDLPGIRSFIKDDFNGLLFEVGNSYELAQKIEYLIKNKDIANKLGKNAYEEVVKNFNLDKNSKLVYDFILKGE